MKVRMKNPVRAGLIGPNDEWPYAISSDDLDVRSRRGVRFGEPPLLDVQQRLRRGAAESAGKRRGDVWRCNHLFGWFFRRHLLTRWRAHTWWRIQQATVLDDFLNL